MSYEPHYCPKCDRYKSGNKFTTIERKDGSRELKCNDCKHIVLIYGKDVADRIRKIEERSEEDIIREIGDDEYDSWHEDREEHISNWIRSGE